MASSKTARTWNRKRTRRWKKTRRWRSDLARGGRHKDRDGIARRCIASGESENPERMVRFVLDPEGSVVPDVSACLPGRGVWLKPSRKLLEKALAGRLFSRGFKTRAHVSGDLIDLVERLLLERLVSTLSLARKAGKAVTGFEKVKARLLARPDTVLVQAADGAAEQKAKLARLAGDRTTIGVLSSDELGLAFGRDFAIHAALDAGGLASRALSEARRLSGLRPGTEVRTAGELAVFATRTAKTPARTPWQDAG